MSGDGSAAERAVVSKLARGSLLSRLRRSKQPLKLIAVPRDHVQGERSRGDALLAGRLHRRQRNAEAQGPRLRRGRGNRRRWPSSFRASPGCAISPPPRRAKKARGWPKRSSAAGCSPTARRIDEAWAPHLWGERILFWTAYAPYILSSGDSGYRSALLNTLARGARHLDASADKASAGLDRVTAWCGVVAAGLLVQGGVPRVARGEAGLARALASAQFDDGGLISRSPFEQVQLVDRFGLLRACYVAAKQTMPDGIEAAAQASLAALHGIMMGDGALSSWQGCNPGEAARLAALIDGCGLRARPLRQARGWGYQRMSALGTILVLDAAPPPPQKMRRPGFGIDPGFRTVRRGASGWSSIAAGPGRCRPISPKSWSKGSGRPRRTARWSSPTPTRPTSSPTARSARASRTSPSSAARTMTPAASRRATTAMSVRSG